MNKKERHLKSPLNYVGGKYKLLPQILPLFPKNIDTFVDLFCGGCNVGINLDCEEYIFNDILTPIVDMYKKFIELGTDETIRYIKSKIEEYDLSLTNVDGYNKLRETYNSNNKCNPLDLFVLVAYSFNHQIRFNQKGGFNMPFGKDRSHYNLTMEKNLISFVDRLLSIREKLLFTNKDFMDIDFESLNLTQNSFVYVDPPYLISTGSYNDARRGYTFWDITLEKELLKFLDSIDKNNIKFGLSNVLEHKGEENKILMDWIEYNDYNVHYLNIDYSNSNYQKHKNGNSKTKSLEVFITNY